VGRYRSANRADLTALCLVASCALFVTTAVWADPSQYDQLQTDQFQDEQPQPKHKKRMVHRVDAAAPTASLDELKAQVEAYKVER